LFRKHNIDEISTIVDDCMKLLIIEKELCKNSVTMSLTFNALIKEIISPEAQILLNSLAIVGIYNIPIPSFITNEIEKLIISDSLLSESCFKELKDLSIIRNYPYPVYMKIHMMISALNYIIFPNLFAIPCGSKMMRQNVCSTHSCY